MWEAEAPGEFCRYNYDFIDALGTSLFIFIYIYIYISGGLQHHVQPCHSWCLDGFVTGPFFCMFPWQGRVLGPQPMHSACQHRRRCGLDENGCRLVNGEAAQMDMAWRLLDLIEVGGDPYFLGWFQIQALLIFNFSSVFCEFWGRIPTNQIVNRCE